VKQIVKQKVKRKVKHSLKHVRSKIKDDLSPTCHISEGKNRNIAGVPTTTRTRPKRLDGRLV
jgi:hypothetical protein